MSGRGCWIEVTMISCRVETSMAGSVAETEDVASCFLHWSMYMFTCMVESNPGRWPIIVHFVVQNPIEKVSLQLQYWSLLCMWAGVRTAYLQDCNLVYSRSDKIFLILLL